MGDRVMVRVGSCQAVSRTWLWKSKIAISCFVAPVLCFFCSSSDASPNGWLWFAPSSLICPYHVKRVIQQLSQKNPNSCLKQSSLVNGEPAPSGSSEAPSPSLTTRRRLSRLTQQRKVSKRLSLTPVAVWRRRVRQLMRFSEHWSRRPSNTSWPRRTCPIWGSSRQSRRKHVPINDVMNSEHKTGHWGRSCVWTSTATFLTSVSCASVAMTTSRPWKFASSNKFSPSWLGTLRAQRRRLRTWPSTRMTSSIPATNHLTRRWFLQILEWIWTEGKRCREGCWRIVSLMLENPLRQVLQRVLTLTVLSSGVHRPASPSLWGHDWRWREEAFQQSFFGWTGFIKSKIWNVKRRRVQT